MSAEQQANQFPGTPEERQKIEQAIPKKAPAKPKKPRRLLVVTLNVHDGKVGGGHPCIPYCNLALDLMGQATGAYATVVDNDINAFRPENLAKFDAICFNNATGVLFEDEGLRKSLLDFVASGKGLVGIHAAAAAFVQWPKYDQFPAFGEMLGATENGGHPWSVNDVITLQPEDPTHPVNAAFAGKAFEISDEVFQFQAPYSREKLHVLLTIDTDKSDMNPPRHFLPERLADKDFAMSWVRQYGKGRIFYSSLGHRPDIFWNTPVLQHFLAGIQFCMGDLEADSTPSAKVKK